MEAQPLWKRFSAEFIASFIVTVSVVFPAISLRDAGLGAFLFIMFTAALGYGLVFLLFRDVSGGHANPATTFAMMLTRQVTILTGLFYWFAQFLGAVIAAYYAKTTFRLDTGSPEELGNLGVALPTPPYKDIQIILAEALGVAIIVFVILMVMKYADKIVASMAVAGAVLVAIVMTAPISGGALNPAREFGPMAAAGLFKDIYVWYYLIAPFIGAAVAALLYTMFSGEAQTFRMAMPKVSIRRKS